MSKQGTIQEQYIKMTETPISKLITTLAIPAIISMLVTNIYNTGDTYFVSQLGTSASGAVGIVFSVMALYQAVGFMCGQGAGSYISRCLGEQKPEDAKRYATTSFYISLIMGAIISIIGLFFLNPILRFLGSTETILPYAREYAIWIFISGPFLCASCVLNNILRYEGLSFHSMVGLSLGGILNLIGDPILMFELDLGVSGAGLSTAISQIISFFVLYYMFVSGKTTSELKPKFMKLFMFPAIAALGMPSLVRQGLNTLSTILLNRQAAPYEDEAIAAMSIVSRLVFFIASLALGMGQGMQPVIGFNYGAGKYKRVRKGFMFTLFSSTCILGVLGTIAFGFSRPIVGWFRDDAKVIEIGTKALRYQCISSIVMPFVFCSNMIFQSIGKKVQATFLAACKSGIFFIPLIIILPEIMGITGVELAQPIADVLTAVVSVPILIPFLRTLTEDKKTIAIQPNAELHRRYDFRNVRPEEADEVAKIEAICFPPNEACSYERMTERAIAAPELFLVAVERETGKIAGFLNGLSTEETAFRDEFFTDISLYKPDGKNVMLLGLDVLPEYRRQGLATEIMYQYLTREQKNNRKTIYLTCLDNKVEMYEHMGYKNDGIANSTWGGEEWYQMRYEL